MYQVHLFKKSSTSSQMMHLESNDLTVLSMIKNFVYAKLLNY